MKEGERTGISSVVGFQKNILNKLIDSKNCNNNTTSVSERFTDNLQLLGEKVDPNTTNFVNNFFSKVYNDEDNFQNSEDSELINACKQKTKSMYDFVQNILNMDDSSDNFTTE